MTVITHVEFLVEEYSMELTLQKIAPGLIGDRTFGIHPFGGKPDLLRKLPARLKGYSSFAVQQGYGVVILVDEDREDCCELKDRIESIVKNSGLASVSSGASNPVVLSRIVVEELEAWLLGDPQAVVAAYPKIPVSYIKTKKYRDPDAIRGGTAEALEHLLKRYGYIADSMRKTDVAVSIATHMDVSSNISRSFNTFKAGLAVLLSDDLEPLRSS